MDTAANPATKGSENFGRQPEGSDNKQETTFQLPPNSQEEAIMETDDAIRAAAHAQVMSIAMLDEQTVSRIISVQPATVEHLRGSAELLGLPGERGWLYPAFQVDSLEGRVNAVAAQVNRRLGSGDDPWGVASWWISENARLRPFAPRDLLRTSREEELLAVVGMESPA